MFDIDFYMNVSNIRKELESGKKIDQEFLVNEFERLRNKKPIVYNIETTNACNMTCKMCPRTTMMTRSIKTMNFDVFVKIVEQLEPHSEQLWNKWIDFVKQEYGIFENDMSENHFFLYIIPKVIQLHGYGDPLLDINMSKYLNLLEKKGFYSYFSCNPANIDLEKTYEMIDSGLNYIKYSIESVDDETHKEIRGAASNFNQSYENIIKVLEYKKAKKAKTVIIITMLDLNRSTQEQDYESLKKAFSNKDVYIYLKSEDQQWYRKDYHGTNSIHWSEFCKHPWMSMTIKSNCEVAMCMEDFNNEIILGNAESEALYDIWNGEKYAEFRMQHFNKIPFIKCTEKCDMKLVGDYITPN